MVVTIVMLVALLFLVVVVGCARFLYSFISLHTFSNHINMKTKALDVFVYLGIGISLVTSVANLLQVVFAAINQKFADVLSSNTYVDMSQSDVRFAISSLVVMFPIYILLSWYVARDIKKFLFKQDIAIRKIMIYCTLFVAVLTLIGTLVSIIYTYLGGELSIRFNLKAFSVFGVALALFGYYYYSLRRDYSKESFVPVFITVFATAIVSCAIIWSISIIGSPSVMRAKKIDSTRLSDISGIQSNLLNRIQMADKLPATLDDLSNAFQGYKVPTDPITKEEYGYRVIQQPTIKMNYTTSKKEMVTAAIFELCATFDTVREVDARGQSVPAVSLDKSGVEFVDSSYLASNYYYDGDMTPFWNHGVGTTCFKRIVTPDMYYGK